MKNKFMKNIFRIAVCVLAIALLIPSMAVSAVSSNTDEMGYETYTYWYDVSSKGARKVVYSKPLYDVEQVVSESTLDCINKSKLVDVHSKDGITYILDTGNSRVVILDKDYNVLKIIYSVVKYPEGTEIPTTPYVPSEEELEQDAATEGTTEGSTDSATG